MSILHNHKSIFFVARFFIYSITTLLLACSGGGDGSDNGSFGVSGVVSGGGTSSSAAPLSRAITSANYVYAVQTNRLGMDYPWRNKTPIREDGSFAISVGKGYSWAFAFVDSSKSGQDMIQGIFKASSLDSVAPQTFGSSSGTDVGNLTIDVAGEAELDPSKYVTYVGDLGMTLAEAEQFGAMDDLSLRYINPDIDNNGVMDMDDPNMPSFSLEINQNYRYGSGSNISYVQRGVELPASTNISLSDLGSGATSIALGILKEQSGFFSSLPGKIELEWSDSGNYTGPNPTVWVSGSLIEPGLNCSIFENEMGCGHSFDATVTDMPDGTYTFRFYSNNSDTTPAETWTFPYVKTSDNSNLTDGFVFPFPVFNVDANDDVISIDYQWMKKEGVGFVPATSNDIEMLVGTDFANIGWGDGSCGDYTCSNTLEWRPLDTAYVTSGTFSYSDVRVGPNAPRKRSDINSLDMSVVTVLGTRISVSVN